MGENHGWGLLTEGSRDEARNECVVEKNLRPPTQTLLFGRMKSLEANTIRLDAEAKPFRKGNPLSSVASEKNPLKGALAATRPDVRSESHSLWRG